MSDNEDGILRAHEQRYRDSVPAHPALIEAARDMRLSRKFLVDRALEWVRARSQADDEPVSLALLVLQQRTDAEGLRAALALLDSQAAARRKLGLMILREFPRLDDAPYPHSAMVVERLTALAAAEPDEDVLGWTLRAISWQCLPAGTDVLLRYRQDQRASIRRVVAWNLLTACERGAAVSPAISAALLELSADPDSDIRWSVFWDVGEFPELFEPYRAEFLRAARRTRADPCEDVREVASRALIALDGFPDMLP